MPIKKKTEEEKDVIRFVLEKDISVAEKRGIIKKILEDQNFLNTIKKIASEAKIISLSDKIIKEIKGDRGDRGFQGPPSPPGRAIVGPKGDSIVGPRGPRGFTGIGTRGPQGETGDQGLAPKHEYQAGKLRFENPDGTWGEWINLAKLIDDLTKQFGGRTLHRGGTTNFQDDETPTGTVNGVNTDFVLAYTPVSGSLKVFVNGARMRVTEDYTFSGSTISFITAPPTGSNILCDYRT